MDPQPAALKPVCTAALVTRNERLSSLFGRVALACGDPFPAAEPGQFVMLRLPETLDPFLSRPYSIHAPWFQDGRFGGIEILYKVVGPATRRLSRLGPGDEVSLLGPLGRGFRVPPGVRRLFLAAGGVGIAPFRFLLERLAPGGPPTMDCRLFFGVRTAEELVCAAGLEARGIPVVTTTDDGSAGAHCPVTDPLAAAVERDPPDLLLACGPRAMLACVAELARRCGIPCQVSLEERMACGIGACLGCAVPGRGGPSRYRHACREGPVFSLEEIDL